MKRELSVKVKLSIYSSICILTLTDGHELWVMTETMRLWIQAAEIRFFLEDDWHCRLEIECGVQSFERDSE